MNSLSRKKYNIQKSRYQISMLLILMCTGYKGLGEFPVQFVMIALGAFLLFPLCSQYSSIDLKIYASTFFLYAVHMTAVIISTVQNRDSYNIVFIFFVLDILAILVFLYFRKDFNLFIDCYLDLMFFFAAVSLVGHIYTNIIGGSLPFITKKGRVWGYAVLYCNIVGNDRNCGPFTEPGAFAEFLCLAVLFEMSWQKRWKRLAVLVVAMITTYSTMGPVLLFLILLMGVMNHIKNRFGRYAGICTVIFSLCLFLVIYLNFEHIINMLANISPELFGKIANKSVNYTARLKGPLVLWQIFRSSPFWGVGYANMHSLFQKYTMGINGIDAPISTLSVGLACFGVGGIIPYIGLFLGIWKQRIATSKKLIVIVFMWACLFSQPHLSWLLMTCFSVFLLENRDCLSFIK